MPDFDLEEALARRGMAPVAGVDEVGRGPLAGPVVAVAVILDPAHIPDGIDDSKKLSEARRESVFAHILATAHIGLCALPPAIIDRLNIRTAALEAMRRAVAALAVAPRHVLVDGRDIPSHLGVAASAIIKGDGKSLSIAAASIVAKVMRDRMMRRLDAEHPVYGFARNMGYPTAIHRSAIAKAGGSVHHRMSFEPFRNETLRR
jgi:ribonuclease HII